MNTGKADDPSGIIMEMTETVGNTTNKWWITLFNCIIQEGAVLEDWNLSFIINLFKWKGNTLLEKNYKKAWHVKNKR